MGLFPEGRFRKTRKVEEGEIPYQSAKSEVFTPFNSQYQSLDFYFQTGFHRHAQTLKKDLETLEYEVDEIRQMGQHNYWVTGKTTYFNVSHRSLRFWKKRMTELATVNFARFDGWGMKKISEG